MIISQLDSKELFEAAVEGIGRLAGQKLASEARREIQSRLLATCIGAFADVVNEAYLDSLGVPYENRQINAIAYWKEDHDGTDDGILPELHLAEVAAKVPGLNYDFSPRYVLLFRMDDVRILDSETGSDETRVRTTSYREAAQFVYYFLKEQLEYAIVRGGPVMSNLRHVLNIFLQTKTKCHA